jgi:F-type H+-transporting ATPase subunit a
MGIRTALDEFATPLLPTILLAAEKIPGLGGITNTLIATVLTDVVILSIFGFGLRALRRNPDDLVPRSYGQSLIEALVEWLYNMARSVLGDKTRRVFWVGATIFIFIIMANWTELLPGFDSVGIIEHAPPDVTGYRKGTFLGIPALVRPLPEEDEAGATQEEPQAKGTPDEAKPHDEGYILVPFLRAANTDLNTTLALALVAVVMIQFYGMRELGLWKYISGRFVQVKRLSRREPIGAVDLFVGFLELVSELAKILSFSLRLFGNIFAGQVLLFVMSFLIPFVFPGVLIFWGLELFVGAIQALVFMMLTFVFMATVMASHGKEHN